MPNYSTVLYTTSLVFKLLFFKVRKKLKFSSDYYGKKKKSRAKVKLFVLPQIVQGTVLGGVTEEMIGLAFRR